MLNSATGECGTARYDRASVNALVMEPRIGLWTKADSVTVFDQLIYGERR